jgi:hypothetical protein
MVGDMLLQACLDTVSDPARFWRSSLLSWTALSSTGASTSTTTGSRSDCPAITPVRELSGALSRELLVRVCVARLRCTHCILSD